MWPNFHLHFYLLTFSTVLTGSTGQASISVLLERYQRREHFFSVETSVSKYQGKYKSRLASASTIDLS